MARALLKSWQDKRPAWTKRVRWYEPGEKDGSHRLEFTDTAVGTMNKHYTTKKAAQEAFTAFKNAEFTVAQLYAEQASANAR